jgi:hypothetical protein
MRPFAHNRACHGDSLIGAHGKSLGSPARRVPHAERTPRPKVDAQSTRGLHRQVRGIPPQGIANVGDRPPDLPVEVAGLNGPVSFDERCERMPGGGSCHEQVVRCHLDAVGAAGQRTSRVVVTGIGLARLSRTGEVS